ncbi:LacI family DNA-binding transcriptional regulator [Cohnella thailandensis]|uniref:LacI family DNA-binding transcriptional regulator n=1 Tax=Cohnella thailandensis TaxID=557557 RepID=A0A841T455_9BACL|nr:LacI family DNA-binding transcriptional regulator [Cohnella thailandensis]MBB6637779.1 LacI family DNA-binding transcriptional regulator [Cohnella thailandensis]MBP1974043.1 LacI family transcriptional regulator [Cohnella thailandensis]
MKIDDIARLANVSKSAVSLALNGKPGVGPETRDKILKIAQDTGYVQRSQVHAQQVYRTNRFLRLVALTNSGIVLDEFEKQPFFTELIRHIEDQCSSNGYSLLFSSIQGDLLAEEIQRLATDVEASGLILLGTNLTREQVALVSGQIANLVVLDTCHESVSADFVVMNNFMGGYQAARHLIELGHRRIGYVQSKSRMHNFDSRRKGFDAALEEFGLTLAPEHAFTILPTVVSSQEEFLQGWSGLRGDRPTALFCECDYMAISVIKSAHELGIRVPDELSVIGFDDIAEAEVITPELTTIHVEKETIAALAVERLIRLTEQEGRNLHLKTLVDTSLVVRKSTKALE